MASFAPSSSYSLSSRLKLVKTQFCVRRNEDGMCDLPYWDIPGAIGKVGRGTFVDCPAGNMVHCMKLSYINGIYYEGYIDHYEFLPHGKGTLCIPITEGYYVGKYIELYGTWVNGYLNGEGIVRYPDDSHSVCKWHFGRKNGKNRFWTFHRESNDGDKYYKLLQEELWKEGDLYWRKPSVMAIKCSMGENIKRITRYENPHELRTSTVDTVSAEITVSAENISNRNGYPLLTDTDRKLLGLSAMDWASIKNLKFDNAYKKWQNLLGDQKLFDLSSLTLGEITDVFKQLYNDWSMANIRFAENTNLNWYRCQSDNCAVYEKMLGIINTQREEMGDFEDIEDMNSVPEGKESSSNNHDEDVGKETSQGANCVGAKCVGANTKEFLESTCSICFENIENGDKCVLKCEHSFHLKCILPWLIKKGIKSTCPNCRGVIDLSSDNEKMNYSYQNPYYNNIYFANSSSSAHI